MTYSPTIGRVNTPELLKKLYQIPILRDLGEEDLCQVAELFFETLYPRESVIFYEQDCPEKTGARIYFITSGSVKLVKYSSDGESTIVRLVSTGEFFGVTGALTNQPNPFSAEALTDTEILYLNKDSFKKLISLYPQVALNIICALGEMLWFNYATHNQVVKKSDVRVAKIILYHLRRDGYRDVPEGLMLQIQLPHDYIASMTGIAYEESVRIISRLKKQQQCIQYLRGGKIIITDLEALREVAQDFDSIGGY